MCLIGVDPGPVLTVLLFIVGVFGLAIPDVDLIFFCLFFWLIVYKYNFNRQYLSRATEPTYMNEQAQPA